MTSLTPAQQHWMGSLKRLGRFSCSLQTVLWSGWLQWSTWAFRFVQIEVTLVGADRVSQTTKSGGGKLVLECRYPHNGINFIGNDVAFGSLSCVGHAKTVRLFELGVELSHARTIISTCAIWSLSS